MLTLLNNTSFSEVIVILTFRAQSSVNKRAIKKYILADIATSLPKLLES